MKFVATASLTTHKPASMELMSVPKLYSSSWSEDEELELIDLLTEESSSSTSSSFQAPGKDLEDVNRGLVAMEETPITSVARKNARIIVQKFLSAHQKMKDKLRKAAGKNLKLSPKKPCTWCRKLMHDLPIRFEHASTKREKYLILTTVPQDVSIPRVRSLFKNCTPFMAKKASALKTKCGAFYSPLYEPLSRGISDVVEDAVIAYYNDDTNSRVMAGERNSVMSVLADGTKGRVQKRLILMSLRELYNNFIRSDTYKAVSGNFSLENAKNLIGVSKFAHLRPRHCVWPGLKGHHNTCVCIVHENFRLLCEVAGFERMPTHTFLETYLCKSAGEGCFLGFCSNCPNYSAIQDKIEQHVGTDDVVYFLWCSTDRTNLDEIRESASDFIQRFLEYLPKVASHHFIANMQNTFMKEVSARLSTEESIICQVDFGMNYTFITRDEVQSTHFSPPQATVHPFVVHLYDHATKKVRHKCYVVLSDDLNHNSNSFHVFRSKVMQRIRSEFPWAKIYYVSDGSAAQYKNFKNLANLVMHASDYELAAEWHFTATAHGKSMCDAVTGVVKSTTRRESLKPGRFIRNVQHMFDFCSERWAKSVTMEILLVKREEVASKIAGLEERYSKARRLVGIQEKHSLVPTDGNTVQIRRFSKSTVYEDFKPFEEEPSVSREQYNVGSYVAIRVDKSYQIGIIEAVDYDEDMLRIQFMTRSRGTNSFSWPTITRVEEVCLRDCLGQVEAPSTSSSARFYQLSKADFKRLNTTVKVVRRK